VRVEAWFAIAAAFSSEPPFFRYAVMPVARMWRFPEPREYEEYSFDGWEGEDRVKLHTLTKPFIDTDVRRTTNGWLLMRPNGEFTSGISSAPHRGD
jgi:hypothetical protein